MKRSQAALLAGILPLAMMAGGGGYTQRRGRIQSTMPRKWWLRRKARLQMVRESRRRNR